MLIALYAVLGLATAGLLGAALVVVSQVEDWSRDLSTNVAATSDDARDERLQTIESTLSMEQLADVTAQSATELPRWELIERAIPMDGASIELHFVRTTGLFRFQDDIRVRIARAGAGSRLTAESRSRIGKGDLGQNPRNLREMLGKVRTNLR